MKTKLIILLLAGLSSLWFNGCTLGINQRQNIIGVVQSTVGIDVAQGPEGTPHFRLGYVRTQYHVVPTVRNSNEWIYAPPVISSIGVSAKKGEIDEDWATGDAVKYLPDQTASQIKAHYGEAAATRTNRTAKVAATNAPAIK